jgi:hypothetical protein
MTNAVSADLQSLVQSLGVAGAPSQRTEDRSAFVPNVASVRAGATKGPTTPAAPEKDKPCTDANLQRKKTESAQVFAPRVGTNGKPEHYLDFASKLSATILRGEGKAGTATDAGDGAAAETPESEEPAESPQAEGGEFGRQRLNIAAYPARVQRTLHQITRQIQRTTGEEPRMIAEIANFTQFALTAARNDRDAYIAQEQRAGDRLEQLRERKDPRGVEKFRKTEKLLTAIRADKKNAETVCDQLSAVVQEMERLDGGRIRDGFNIIPKAGRILEERAAAGRSDEISASELSAVYTEKVLEFESPSQFYEDFVKNYSHMEFSQFIDLTLGLLGDDMRSVDPSRGNAYLAGILNGLFYVEICNQIYVATGQIGAGVFRFTRLRELEAGTYVPTHLIVALGEDGVVQLSTARGDGEPVPIGRVRMGQAVDHFGAITEAFRDNGIEDFVLLPSPDMDRKSTRQFKTSLMVRYGCQVHDSVPKSEPEPLEVASDELA